MVGTIKLLKRGNTKIIAHRGGRGWVPENSIASFSASAERGYYGIETDVHVTRDGKLIIIHDDNALRVSGVDIAVEEASFEELRKIRLLDTDGVSVRSDLTLPTLEEYIDICKRSGKKAILELKNKMTEDNVYMIYDAVEALGYNAETEYISFYIDNLHAVRRRSPAQRVQYLVDAERFYDGIVAELAGYKYALDIQHKYATAELIDACHKAGIEINVWTVNEPADAERLIELGVDYITTDVLE